MEFIKDRAAFNAFRSKGEVERVSTPLSFPRFVYSQVVSWGMEEDEAVYLYPDDLREMLAQCDGAQ